MLPPQKCLNRLMGKSAKISLLILGFVIICLASFAYFFYITGGARLAIVAVNYLIPNIPNKEYTWVDFTDRGRATKISGFYAGGDEKGFNLWTLSGYKRFRNLPGTSYYIFQDVCAAVQTLKKINSTKDSLLVQDQKTNDILTWEEKVKKEYFVTVQKMPDENNKDFVDKAWAISGKYKVLKRIDEKACE